ncbi:Bug family tripartite tricarboxylate transporter substrate binding protein [Achromobacter deleyi]|uniref:Bug family tripartite tricarboxylate transporter substrate binding protein n=1 Tax=Achromobacter deleyi TaxID=1353891 RepID=UPI001491E216|nr:tripartite tricarboxylate transporter substrate binding protein [Achromobacter deleyi]QVQ26062.1 tripartite tricarboxylate transporter substrate binding protein [Achromobacter deleyi]UIP21615.1 tripartite tricarboxylate transporter substrate binding protein [Achromobacter deleyi]
MLIFSGRARRAVSLCFALLAAAGTGAAHAQWPERPIKLIVPYVAGSGPDVVLRPIAEALGRELGQPVVVDNRGGAGGIVGTQLLATSAPDGYTIGFGNLVTLAINKSMYPKLPYDPQRSLAPISLAISNALVLIARNDLPASNVQELVSYARKNPGKVSVGSLGVGSSAHLAGEMLKSETGTSMLHVPYKSGQQAVVDIAGGQLDVMIDNVAGVLPFIRSGQVKVLGATSARRVPVLPDVPTVDESGLKGFEVVSWGGIVAPAGTPRPIIDKLNAAVAKALQDPAVLQLNATLSVDATPSTPEQFASLIATEIPRWGAMVKRSGASAD